MSITLYSSPFRRARDTAERIRRARDTAERIRRARNTARGIL